MKRKILILLYAAAAVLVSAIDAEAATGVKKRNARSRHAPRKQAVRAPKKAVPEKPNPYRCEPYVGAIVADAQTGRVLFSEGADRPARPASVTKLMTALLVLEDVKAGKYALDAMVSATALATSMEPSIIGFTDGKPPRPVSWSVDTLLYALMIRSANDAAVALAEHSAGSHKEFVKRMNAKAAELGMKSTEYHNPNGLPPNSSKRYPWKSFNVSTCSDQLKLARELLEKHPEILKYTSQKTWTMPNGQKIINHNNVMRKDSLKIVNPDGTEAVDGLKTGYIHAGGSSVVLTGTRNGRRAIVIVLGSATAKMRDEHARRLMADVLSSF